MIVLSWWLRSLSRLFFDGEGRIVGFWVMIDEFPHYHFFVVCRDKWWG
jgi:hypothetical protein